MIARTTLIVILCVALGAVLSWSAVSLLMNEPREADRSDTVYDLQLALAPLVEEMASLRRELVELRERGLEGSLSESAVPPADSAEEARSDVDEESSPRSSPTSEARLARIERGLLDLRDEVEHLVDASDRIGPDRPSPPKQLASLDRLAARLAPANLQSTGAEERKNEYYDLQREVSREYFGWTRRQVIAHFGMPEYSSEGIFQYELSPLGGRDPEEIYFHFIDGIVSRVAYSDTP